MDRLARKARAGTVSEKTKASVTVLEFVSQCVDLKPTESGAIGLCPFHDDHQPSLGVNDEGNYWHVLSSFRPY
jgi:DNA primase